MFKVSYSYYEDKHRMKKNIERRLHPSFPLPDLLSSDRMDSDGLHVLVRYEILGVGRAFLALLFRGLCSAGTALNAFRLAAARIAGRHDKITEFRGRRGGSG